MPSNQKFNIQPFFTGAIEGNMPLSPGPYYSRVEGQELSMEDLDPNDRSKKYQMIAFRPGFPLQASELNEIQEHFQLQMSLSISMMNNWISSGLGNRWGDWSSNSVGGGSNTPPTNIPNTGIGVGGGINAEGITIHDSQYAISAPGWVGSCPLYPFNYPYQGFNLGGTIGPVNVQPIGQSRMDISFYSGWWLINVPGWWDGSNEARDASNIPISGLKHWVYLTASEPQQPIYTVSVDVSSGADIEIPIGFNVVSKYYSCCQTADGEHCVPDLADNANGGEPNSVACGASRYGIEVIGADAAYPDNDGDWGNPNDIDSAFAERENLSLICKVNPLKRTVRYINNLLISDLS